MADYPVWPLLCLPAILDQKRICYMNTRAALDRVAAVYGDIRMQPGFLLGTLHCNPVLHEWAL